MQRIHIHHKHIKNIYISVCCHAVSVLVYRRFLCVVLLLSGNKDVTLLKQAALEGRCSLMLPQDSPRRYYPASQQPSSLKVKFDILQTWQSCIELGNEFWDLPALPSLPPSLSLPYWSLNLFAWKNRIASCRAEGCAAPADVIFHAGWTVVLFFSLHLPLVGSFLWSVLRTVHHGSQFRPADVVQLPARSALMCWHWGTDQRQGWTIQHVDKEKTESGERWSCYFDLHTSIP